ncbi:MAG TPA: ribosome silencing factor [Firmicutes bacterium]|nr:ribosome silencing factor [Bacillota bacterium]HHT43402.1 ribosome silencing factor [Bacillota bacterium]
MTIPSAVDVAKAAAQAADSKKAENVQVLKMPEVMVDAEYFVICSAPTHVQIRAVVEAVTEALQDEGVELLRQEGRDGNNWILLDYGAVIVHVFLDEDRHYYDLERLWADAQRVEWNG